uniref:Spherulin-1b n=1 Tax=Colletotrichum fructicola (strain Nara gc5) TaxID=1213859 RepID=L2G152_COLFN
MMLREVLNKFEMNSVCTVLTESIKSPPSASAAPSRPTTPSSSSASSNRTQILLTYVPGGARDAVMRADLDGNTALHFASGNGNLLVLRTLLAAGADAERRNMWSWTAMSYSATVQAEVYLKGLVTEVERRKMVRREVEELKKAGGVRVVEEDVEVED